MHRFFSRKWGGGSQHPFSQKAFYFDSFSDLSDGTCMMSMFSKKAKVLPDTSERPPQPPTIDQIVEDLDAAKPDDIVFTTDIGLVDVDYVIQQNLGDINCSLQKRFQQPGNKNDKTKDSNIKDENNDEDAHNVNDLYEKVIEYNQNVEKLITLHQILPDVLQNLSELRDELEEDKNRVSNTYKEAVKLYKEVNAQEESNNKLSEQLLQNNGSYKAT